MDYLFDTILIVAIAIAAVAVVVMVVRTIAATTPLDNYTSFDRWQESFNQGIVAAHDGRACDDNPHHEGTPEFDAWEEGWELASHYVREHGGAA